MKLIKKTGIVFTVIFVFLLSSVCSACRFNNTKVGEYKFLPPISYVLYPYGVPLGYRFKNASIEVSLVSDKGMLVFDCYDEIKNWEEYSYFIEPQSETEHYHGYKKALHGENPVRYEGQPVFQWRPVDGWFVADGYKDDYITFIARKEDKIVGYAVIYVWADGEKGGGKVLKDKKCSNISGEYVNDKIDKVIEKHKSSLNRG